MPTYRIDFAGTIRKSEITPEGYLRCDATIARIGVQEYRDRDGRIRREYRPESEVADPESLKTFGLMPVTLGHPPVLVNSDNSDEYMVGLTSQPVVYSDGFVQVAITLTDKKAVNAVRSGKVRQISAGYQVDLDHAPSVTEDGEKYDAVQTHIRGNHVALVPRGRAGSEVRLHLDSVDDDLAIEVDQEISQKGRVGMAQITLGSVSYDASEALAAAVNQRLDGDAKRMEEMSGKLDMMKKKMGEMEDGSAEYADMETEYNKLKADYDKMKGKCDALEEKCAALTEQVESRSDESDEDLQTRVDALVNEKISLLQQFSEVLGAKYDHAGKGAAQIKRDALVAKMPKLDLTNRSDEWVDGACEIYFATKQDAAPSSTGDLKNALDQVQKSVTQRYTGDSDPIPQGYTPKALAMHK